VRTIEVVVHPLGGDNFKIRLDATRPSVGEAKAEIACVQGTEEARQELYRVEVREVGGQFGRTMLRQSRWLPLA
jgi:hypothetical protein